MLDFNLVLILSGALVLFLYLVMLEHRGVFRGGGRLRLEMLVVLTLALGFYSIGLYGHAQSRARMRFNSWLSNTAADSAELYGK